MVEIKDKSRSTSIGESRFQSEMRGVLRGVCILTSQLLEYFLLFQWRDSRFNRASSTRITSQLYALLVGNRIKIDNLPGSSTEKEEDLSKIGINHSS